MNLFDDLEENLQKTYNTSLKESLDDIGLDEEERDKIVYRVSGSTISNLNVNYSDFSNHIFFGSAYAAANFALARVIRDYPTDGELKEKNQWRQTNTGYENWFFDNFPKQQGYLHIGSGSLHSYAQVTDYENKLSYSTGSNGLNTGFTVEFVIQPYTEMVTSQVYPVFSFLKSTAVQGMYAFITNGVSGKTISFTLANPTDSKTVTASIDQNFSQSFHVAFSCDGYQLYSLINGELHNSASLGTMTAAVDLGGQTLFLGQLSSTVGYYHYSGTVDDFRFWTTFRNKELIKRNYYRTIHANHSGGLSLYWKFNEPSEYGNTIIDYSGKELHGALSGTSFSVSSNLKSGTLGEWFKDSGDPILALQNSRTDAFITEQRTSGSNYDDDNQNMIFNLVPGVFVDGDDTEYQQLFLLLTARHFDRLKLYIEHLSNITKQQTSQFDGPPSNLLDLVAKHYGFDIGGIYAAANPLQNYFGENVYTSGSLESNIEVIRNVLKRNVVSNLTHILKSKGTQTAIKNTLHAIGLNDSIVSISEYTDFSGGVQTTFTPKTVERRVAHFLTSSNIFATSSIDYTTSSDSISYVYQNRFLLNTASLHLTQTLMSYFEPNGTTEFAVFAERSNLTSSMGKLRFVGSGTVVTSSTQPIWNNNWNNLTVDYTDTTDFTLLSFYLSSMDRGGVIFEVSSSGNTFVIPTSINRRQMRLGTSGTAYFDGYMSEFRAWTHDTTWRSRFEAYKRWGLDWELTEVDNVLYGYSDLISHLKLDDFTGSATGGGPIHDYVSGRSGSSYLGFSSSAQSNFPGKYIDKFDVSHTYDLNVDNDKIRIRNGSTFTDNDQNIDIPFVSIDFSPITSLNKEIMKWMGNLERIVQIANDPIYQYRDTNALLDALRSTFFREKVNNRIDYQAFANLIKWFDNNFGFLLSQLIPLDMGYSISNYVIEPHIFEYNKVKKFVGAGAAGKTTNLEATVAVLPRVTASSTGNNLGLADPGRYGAFVSASANVCQDVYLVYKSSSNGINHKDFLIRRVMDVVLRDDLEKNTPDGYGNGFYIRTITGSNYLKNTLNVNPHFAVSGVYFSGAGNLNTNFLSSSHGVPTTPWTGSFNGYQDARWLWMGPVSGSPATFDLLKYTTNYSINYGIGYGGMWGQLHARSNRAYKGTPLRPPITDATDMPAPYIGGVGEGPVAYGVQIPNIPFQYIRYFNEDDLRTFIFWPTLNDFDGIDLVFSSAVSTKFIDNTVAIGLGEPIKIEGYDTLNIEILGRTNPVIIGAEDFVINVELKFQFFSADKPGDFGYETIMSASRVDANSNYELQNVPVIYNLTTEAIPRHKPASFQLSLERSLPKQRYMRVWVSPTLTTNSQGALKMQFKAIISNKQKTADELPIRDI